MLYVKVETFKVFALTSGLLPAKASCSGAVGGLRGQAAVNTFRGGGLAPGGAGLGLAKELRAGENSLKTVSF